MSAQLLFDIVKKVPRRAISGDSKKENQILMQLASRCQLAVSSPA